MEINADFYSDFIKLNLEIINDLEDQGFQFEKYEDWKKRKGESVINILSKKKSDMQENDLIDAYKHDLVFYFANLMERIPDYIPRKIHKCKSFTCPDKYQKGLDSLENVIRNGGDLIPYLSRQIVDARKNDRMLFVLGIIHFHLGIKQINNKSLFVEGTDDILYAFIYEQDCYFIKIDKHGHWVDTELLRLLHNDFPKVLTPWKLKDVSPGQLSDNDRKKLWNKNVITLIEINNEVYAPPGWGTSVMGTSITARINYDRYIHYLTCLEKKLILLLNQQREKMEADFNKKIKCMRLSLCQMDPIMIFDEENNLLIGVNSFDDEGNLSVRISKVNRS